MLVGFPEWPFPLHLRWSRVSDVAGQNFRKRPAVMSALHKAAYMSRRCQTFDRVHFPVYTFSEPKQLIYGGIMAFKLVIGMKKYMSRSIGILMLSGFFLLASVANAQITYTYLGNNFDKVSGPYTTANRVSGEIVVSSKVSANGPSQITEDMVLSYSFSDGVRTFTQSNSIMCSFFLDIDAAGAVESWRIRLRGPIVSSQDIRQDYIETHAPPHDSDKGGILKLEDARVNCAEGPSLEEGSVEKAGTWTASALDPDEVINLSLEEPRDGSVYSGIGNIRGWALSFEEIDKVELYIDGKFMGAIPYGGLRNDVSRKYPQVPGSENSGFSMAFGYNGITSGEHTVKVRAISETGIFKEKSATFTVVTFHQPFFPNPNAVSLSNSEVDKDGSDIVIHNLSVDGKLYDVRLRWKSQTQGFELIEIR